MTAKSGVCVIAHPSEWRKPIRTPGELACTQFYAIDASPAAAHVVVEGIDDARFAVEVLAGPDGAVEDDVNSLRVNPEPLSAPRWIGTTCEGEAMVSDSFAVRTRCWPTR